MPLSNDATVRGVLGASQKRSATMVGRPRFHPPGEGAAEGATARRPLALRAETVPRAGYGSAAGPGRSGHDPGQFDGSIVDGAGRDRDWLCLASDSIRPGLWRLCGGGARFGSDAWEESRRHRPTCSCTTRTRTCPTSHGLDTACASCARPWLITGRGLLGLPPMFTRVNARNRLIVAAEHAAWSSGCQRWLAPIVRAARRASAVRRLMASPGYRREFRPLRRRHARRASW